MEINPQEHKPERLDAKKKSSSRPLLIAAILLGGAAAAASWFYLCPTDHQVPNLGQNTVPTISQPAKTGKKPLKMPATTQETTPQTVEQTAAVQPTPTLQTEPEPLLTPEAQCSLLSDRLVTFFTHLDNEPYIKEYNLGRPSKQYFAALAEKLLANPPTVTRESDDLYTILTNMAHFFRIIGRNNILIIKSILDRERDKIEDIAADLYQWTIVDQCRDNNLPLKAPLEKVYEYAGFFLNTMGGRSYLFRRDSRSRLLVNYYALLIIDRANREGLNLYGIDLKPIIPKLIQEIEATNQLIYKEDYIDRLVALQEKYQDVR
jgi:hypothetical protein